MKLKLNFLKTLNENKICISRMMAVCLLSVTCAIYSGISVQAALIIDTTTSQASLIPDAYNAQTSSMQNITSVQMASAPGSISAMMASTPGTAYDQTALAPNGTGTQMTQATAASTVSPMASSRTCGVGELWMLGSETGAQNLSIVIKSPHGKLVVVDGGWEADAEKLSSLILQQGGKIDAWLITHPHEDHVGALCAILNDTARKIKIDKIYCSLATPDWYRQVSPTGAGIADQLLSAFTKLPVGTVTNNIGRGTEINIDDVNIRILNNRGVYTYNGVNNSSMVYKIRVSDQSILILGDLAYDGGKDLIKTCTAAELKSDIVQMAHHGQQGVDQDAYALIAPTTCLWPTPAWLWDNDNGGGIGSGPWGTLTTRGWMDALGVKDNRSLKDGDVHMYLGMPSPNM
jgi:beta-lactamase superfamily II metal-dependent hydrolase